MAPVGSSDVPRDFDAGTLCLQYLDAPEDPEDLSGWARTHLQVRDLLPLVDDERRDAQTLHDAVSRIAAMLVVGGAPSIGDIARLNRLADQPDLAPQVGAGGARGWPIEVSHGQVLATVARDAVLLVTDADHDRVRRCAAEDCDLVFLDTSRPGRRRWCSMSRCGNRAKVRAHRARASGPIHDVDDRPT
ncbi:hypothetical protein DVS28_a3356 [Euzebya pacifica]|uniref:Zinc finger CGNR domain-containing protein n=1 Tax=Euzebya pacifica TaxID=1608957 RepID=A0A346Y0N4_9ACTN|nr:CGNR zinc finger domain-containing protein [Euzebya pacifica]AXV08031.1 hypothetical protein DVS28_a3356 [Euzebya pacifica]